MKRNKVSVGGIFAVCLFLLGTVFTGCGKEVRAPKSEKDAEPHTVYAVIFKSLSDPFTETARRGVEEEAVRLGITVDIFYANDAADIHGQLQILKDCIEKGYKAIGIAPLTTDADLSEGLSVTEKKGIYTVLFGDTVNLSTIQEASGVFAAVTVNAEQLGAQGANYIVSKLTKGGAVAVLSESLTEEKLKQGAENAVRGATGVRLIDTKTVSAEGNALKSRAEQLISKNADLKAFYCCNDKTALEVCRAVQNVGKSEEVLIVGTGGTEAARKSIENGVLTATIAVDFAEIGARTLREMYSAVQSGAVAEPTAAPEIIFVDSYILEKGNP